MVRRLLRLATEGPLAVRLRRFLIVGLVAAAVQQTLLFAFVELGRLNYLIAAAIAIETTIILQYGLNNVWTFNADRKTGRRAYVYGLLKTNIVRGSAIPLQLAALYALVAFLSLGYLVANAFAIGMTGVYRYVLDSQWTWS